MILFTIHHPTFLVVFLSLVRSIYLHIFSAQKSITDPNTSCGHLPFTKKSISCRINDTDINDCVKGPPVNDACAVSTSVTICCVLSCSVGEPVNKETKRYVWSPVTDLSFHFSAPVGVSYQGKNLFNLFLCSLLFIPNSWKCSRGSDPAVLSDLVNQVCRLADFT